MARRMFVTALIAGLPVVLLAGAWRLGGVSALEDDLIYYLPIRQYIGERLRAGELPLWNPLTMMGTSIAADPQSGLWYPPTYLFALLPPLVAYPVTLILHFALAGGGMYRFLRACRHDWRAALLGAIAFEFCGYLIAHRAHLTIHHAAAWLPWILLGWRRFADTRRFRHFALASLALGLQLLVQHVQVSIITVALLTGYVAAVLWPRCRALLWQYPAGLALGAAIGAIQLVPTGLHFAATGRSAPCYSVFVENSWVPTSGLMFLFPMLFGSRTPNFWSEPWWGISHFCEQCPYGSILILLLAIASLAMLKRGSSRREVAFWWLAALVALILAAGDLTPLSKWLFHLPVYRNLRVPARWILVWSVAMPVLASMTVSALLSERERVTDLARWVGITATRILPLLALAGIVVMLLARWQAGALATAYSDRYDAGRVLAGLKTAIRPGNPAIWWPMLVMLLTGGALARWVTGHRPRLMPLLFCVMLVDLTSVVAFVDVDVRTYRRNDLLAPPPLVQAINDLKPAPGHRLLVPRLQADYDRPLEVLWPNTNLQHGIATFNGYGPFWPAANRLLFRFMPWGSSEAMLELLRNLPLMQAMGIRFIAVRTTQERKLLELAVLPTDTETSAQELLPGSSPVPVRYGDDLLLPVSIDKAGLYDLVLDAEPVPGSPSRWYVRLETASGEEIGWTRTMEPVDLVGGPCTVHFIFNAERAADNARVRIKAQMGHALSVARAAFRRVAIMSPGYPTPFTHRANLPGNVSLYELPGAAELVHWATATERVADVGEAVERLHAWAKPDSQPVALVETPAPDGTHAAPDVLSRPARDATLAHTRPAGHELRIEAASSTGGLVVFNETYDLGWRAAIDGQAADVLRVNAVVQGVVVPPGQHHVRFIYRPRGLVAGATVSCAALLLLVGGALVTARRRER